MKIFTLLTATLIISGSSLYAQQTVQTTKQTVQPTNSTTSDRGSRDQLTMEEYEQIRLMFEKENPGKTFRDLSKEEFETYLTNKVIELRSQKATAPKTGTSPK